jgi:hypothetical protein
MSASLAELLFWIERARHRIEVPMLDLATVSCTIRAVTGVRTAVDLPAETVRDLTVGDLAAAVRFDRTVRWRVRVGLYDASYIWMVFANRERSLDRPSGQRIVEFLLGGIDPASIEECLQQGFPPQFHCPRFLGDALRLEVPTLSCLADPVEIGLTVSWIFVTD